VGLLTFALNVTLVHDELAALGQSAAFREASWLRPPSCAITRTPAGSSEPWTGSLPWTA